MSHTAGELSGGQKAKLFFLKMVLDQNDVLILDEPTRNFSPLSNPVIRQILKEYGGAIISVTHDRKYLDEVCNQLRAETGGPVTPPVDPKKRRCNATAALFPYRVVSRSPEQSAWC